MYLICEAVVKGVFLGENHILDNVGMSLASEQQTQTRVRMSTVLFVFEKTNTMVNSHRLCDGILDKSQQAKNRNLSRLKTKRITQYLSTP